MSKLKNYLGILILILSLGALYWITGSRTPWHLTSGSGGPSGETVAYLGDVQVANYDRMGFTKALVQYVAPEDAWLVGTERAELFLFDKDGHQLWKRSLGTGKLVSLALTRDGTKAFIGEQSADGNLYCVDARTGDLLWQRKGTDAVGSDAGQRSYPMVAHVAVDKADNVYATVYRFLMNKRGERSYNGRMVSLDAKGGLRYQFPPDEAMDSWVNWCDVSDAAGLAMISTCSYDYRTDMKYGDTIYVLDQQTGKLLHHTLVPPVPPFDNTVMRCSPSFSPDGQYLAGSSSDGRAMLFDNTGKLLWTRVMSKPTLVDDAWINASGRDGVVLPQGVLFTTINTFNRENWQLPTPVEHPGDNSLFVWDLDGKFKYQFRAEGTMEALEFTDKVVACAIGRNVRNHNYKAHGALLVDLDTGKQVQFWPTEGPLQTIAISPDGRQVAGIEAPAVTPEGKILGAYRLHIWKRE